MVRTAIIIICVFNITACTSKRPERSEIRALIDQDNDGIGQLEDCDDNDPQVISTIYETTNSGAVGCFVGGYCAKDIHCRGAARLCFQSL